MNVEKKYIKDAQNEDNFEIDIFKSIETGIVSYRNKYGVAIPLESTGTPDFRNVYDNLIANNTSSNTTAVLNYGVNVFTTVTTTNYAAKLPQPKTGRTTVIVNNSSSSITLYPSNIGGKINNYAINVPAIIPPDGKAYTFYCIENPLPGAWTWNAPATTQYFSDIITIPSLVSGGSGSTNPIYSIYNSTNYVNRGTSWGAFAEAEDGKNKPLVFSNSSGVYFKFSPYATGIAKVKVYTNLLGKSTFALTGSAGSTYYNTTTGAFENNEYVMSGNLSVYQDTNNVIGGTPVGTYVSTNIGDPGTYYGELVLPTGIYTGGLAPTIVGDKFLGQVINPNTGVLADLWACGYLNLEIKPLSFIGNYGTVSNVKIQFGIEYY
jgi:hypothetical protein